MEARSADKRITPSVEARRLAEVAKAAGLGDSPDAAIEGHRQALALLGSDEPTPLLVDVLRWQGTVLGNRGRTSDAEPLFRQSTALAEQLGYTAGVAQGMNCLAGLAQRRGDLGAAMNLLTRALELAERCDESRLVGNIHQNLGILADIRGAPMEALAHYRVALRTYEASHDEQRTCWLLINVAYLHAKEGRFDDAEDAFVRGLGIARARGDLMSEGLFEENRAESRLIQGRVDEAFELLTRALEVAQLRRDDVRRAAALKLRGAYERLTGRPAAAVETLRHALTLSALGEDALLGGEVLYQFGCALFDDGDEATAKEVWQTALEAFERMAAKDWIIRLQDVLTRGHSGRYL